jgi:hypothetical protein
MCKIPSNSSPLPQTTNITVKRVTHRNVKQVPSRSGYQWNWGRAKVESEGGKIW